MLKLRFIASTQDFRLVYQKGKSVANRYLVLYSLTRPKGEWRAGIAVSRKVSRAVDRNRIKRLLREGWRQAGKLEGEPHDIVLVGREALLGEKSGVAASALADLLKKAGLRRDKQ